MTALEVLKKYWNYDSFRTVQEEVINHVLSGKHAFVLMPTGGGKSLCFQVPALLLPGITIVVSPLVSLMKDQVARLRALGVKAEAIYSGMHHKDITRIFDNCLSGRVKLLYLSPERLKTQLFKDYSSNYNVSMIVADEAHCISQWGYDFRPNYLYISEFIERFPEARVMALTASATPDVVDDICKILRIEGVRRFQISFFRKNLSYVCRETHDKRQALMNLIRGVPGSGIVYCRSRRATAEVAQFLVSQGVSADFYHAGLDMERLSSIQRQWMEGKTRVMVATTAFGMGIDKPDVRFVVHLVPPASPEEYYQEAGRGGRDGKKAYASLFYDEDDLIELAESEDKNFPDAKEITQLYQNLALYFGVASGPQEETFYEFDLIDFCKASNYKPIKVITGLKELERQFYVEVSESIYQPNEVRILYNKTELYDFQLRYPDFDSLIVILLRLYGGILSMPVKISLKLISEKLNTSVADVKEKLDFMDKSGVILYKKQRDKPSISFGLFRSAPENMKFDFELQNFLKERYRARVNAMLAFIHSPVCRNKPLLEYFGEAYGGECGLCDICIYNKKAVNDGEKMDHAIEYLMNFALTDTNSMQNLINSPYYISNKNMVNAALHFLLQEGKINIQHFRIVRADG